MVAFLLTGDKPICQRFNIDADRVRQSWPDIFHAEEDQIRGDPRVTLVTQFTPDRFARLAMTANNWPGRNVVAPVVSS
jgi:hypothetical protein